MHNSCPKFHNGHASLSWKKVDKVASKLNFHLILLNSKQRDYLHKRSEKKNFPLWGDKSSTKRKILSKVCYNFNFFLYWAIYSLSMAKHCLVLWPGIMFLANDTLHLLLWYPSQTALQVFHERAFPECSFPTAFLLPRAFSGQQSPGCIIPRFG